MKKVSERACVNQLVKALQKNTLRAYIHVDRDSGSARHTSSGWDFLVAWDRRVVFCEAKMGNEKLTDWQELTRALINSTGGIYKVIRFWDNGETFTVTQNALTTEKIKTENMSIQNLL